MWLQEGHSLIKLCKKASLHNTEFRKFIKDYAFLNGYYIETRYPAEDPLIADEEDVKEGMRFAETFVKFIKGEVVILIYSKIYVVELDLTTEVSYQELTLIVGENCANRKCLQIKKHNKGCLL